MNESERQFFARFQRQVEAAHNKLFAQVGKNAGELELMKKLAKPRSITEEIDSIPGRRLWYNLVGRVAFTAADDGRRGNPVNMLVSQDGPFIATHYPMAIWIPTDGTNLGRWRPVSSWPLPDQVLDLDIIDISYEVQDGGSNRNFQNEAVPPVLSRPDMLAPLPVPTMFTPNTTVQFTPTYENILFNDTTTASLVVAIPGYRIANM